MHHKLLHSRFRVHDPAEANLFYVPYYTRFVQYCTTPSSEAVLASMEQDLFNLIIHEYPYWNRTHGKDHVMALGFIEREHAQRCQWCSALLLNPVVKHMSFFAIERDMRTNTQRQSNVIAVPYPSTVHFHSSPPSAPTSRPRVILVSCIASDQQLPFRLMLKSQLQEAFPFGKQQSTCLDYYNCHES